MLSRTQKSRLTIIGLVSAVVFLALYVYSGGMGYAPVSSNIVYVDSKTGKVLSNFSPPVQQAQEPILGENAANAEQKVDAGKPVEGSAGEAKAEEPPIKDNAHEEAAALKQIEESTDNLRKDAGDSLVPGRRVKATFVTLARNREMDELVKAIRQVEDRFNRKFHYDWVFLNDEPFTDEFKEKTSSLVSGTAKYGLVPKEHWSYPDFIDLEKAAEGRKKMAEDKIIYGDSESYRHMCRFESGFFYRHELMQEYDWYWRVEPGIEIRCDVNYDLFRYLEDHNKVYGFAISIHEFERTIPTLWQHTKDFIKAHPEHVAKDNFMEFISDDGGEKYNLCHFWSNFEVASLKFFRSKAYSDYFDYLDKQGGFFYERWGDAPVHSIAVSLFLPKDKIHYFDDLAYRHGVYGQCPLNNEFRKEHRCVCNPKDDFTFRSYSCGEKYHDKMNLEKPKEWIDYRQ